MEEFSWDKLQEKINALPPFSRKVYDTIQAGMYAEPGFSDVTVSDIAIKLQVKQLQVVGAIAHLTKVGLVYTTQDSNSDTPDYFIHTHEHNQGIKPPTIDKEDRTWCTVCSGHKYTLAQMAAWDENNQPFFKPCGCQ